MRRFLDWLLGHHYIVCSYTAEDEQPTPEELAFIERHSDYLNRVSGWLSVVLLLLLAGVLVAAVVHA